MDATDTTAPGNDFDLSQYEMADTSVITLKNIRGDDDLKGRDGKPVTAVLYSTGSKEGVRALHKAGLAQQMRLTRTLRGELDKNDAEKADQERVVKLVGFTKSISDNFPVKPEALYSNAKLGYITKQVEAFIDKDANFEKGSSES